MRRRWPTWPHWPAHSGWSCARGQQRQQRRPAERGHPEQVRRHLQIRCGNWSASRSTGNRFVTTVDASNPRNAVQVIAERSVLPFFGQNTSLPTVSVEAVARRSEPTAVFAVGSQLLRTNGDSVLLSTLRLVGLDVTNATVLSYDGLAQANVTPSGLLKALNIPVSANLSVADFNRLLSVNKISLAQLVDATATVVGRDPRWACSCAHCPTWSPPSWTSTSSTSCSAASPAAAVCSPRSSRPTAPSAARWNRRSTCST
jgi:hypothetical protein